MYISWRRQEAINESQEAERQAAKVEKEIMFYRAGMSATIPAWAQAIADNRSLKHGLRVELARAYMAR